MANQENLVSEGRINASSVFGPGRHGKVGLYVPLRTVALILLMALSLLGLDRTVLAADPPGQWQVREPSSQARQEVSYVEANGKFYLAGGTTTGLHERYDPKTNSWTTVKPLPVPDNKKLDHIQGVQLGGKIYYIGGLSAWPGPHVDTMYVYDPATDSFTKGTPMPAGRARGAGGVASYGGKIYYAGGLHDGKAVPWFDVYDPKTNTWSQLPNMPRARDHFQAAVVSGKFYAIGGRNSGISLNATTPKVDVYDLSKGSGGAWRTPNTELPTQRGGFATAVLEQEILVIGGEGGGKAHNAVEAYNTITNSWRTMEPMPTPRHGTQAVVCNGGVYVAAGGTRQGGGGATAKHEVFFLDGPTACGAAPGDTKNPTITKLRPAPSSVTRDRTPTVSAIVRDRGTDLAKRHIKLIVDGKKQVRFTYNRSKDRLTYTTPRLKFGRHSVRIVAKDAAGNRIVKNWNFKVVKGR